MTSPNEAEGQIPRKHGFVLLIDALGTKGVTGHLQPGFIVERWSRVLRDIADWTDDLNSVGGAESPIAYSIALSDTIYVCIESPFDDPIGDIPLLDNFANIIHDAIFQGVFLRGAISYGLYFHRDTQVFGPAVEEAADWYEGSEWIGVSATPSLHHALDLFARQRTKEQSTRFLAYESVPFKQAELNSYKPFWALGWPLVANDLNLLKDQVQSAFLDYAGAVPPSVFPKFLNTLCFIEHVLDLPKPEDASDYSVIEEVLGT